MLADGGIRRNFLDEMEALAAAIRQKPRLTGDILRRLDTMKDVAGVLGEAPAYRLCRALGQLYGALREGRVAFSENILRLISFTADRLCAYVQGGGEGDILSCVIYCDKAAAGEILDADVLAGSSRREEEPAAAVPDRPVQLSFAGVNAMLNSYEGLLARSFKINGQLEQLPPSPVQRQSVRDVQLLQTEIQLLHKRLLGTVKDDSLFLSKHQPFYGFFVSANDKKYFISSKYIVDVTFESYLEYVTEQNQRCLRLVKETADGGESVELVPVYSLSSLFTEQKVVQKSGVDIIMITEYMNQRIGMIVDKVQRFASLVKKKLPRTLAPYSILEGVVFDEVYDMVPILFVPEILKRFRSQRGYDVKKFEANTKRRVYKVLVVDDSETSRQVEQAILKGNGFAVDQAEDGIRALELLKARQYDLVITDDSMPRMDGGILIDNLRRMENYASVPVVVVAAGPIEKADAFVSKVDFDRNDLIQTIRGLLHE